MFAVSWTWSTARICRCLVVIFQFIVIVTPWIMLCALIGSLMGVLAHPGWLIQISLAIVAAVPKYGLYASPRIANNWVGEMQDTLNLVISSDDAIDVCDNSWLYDTCIDNDVSTPMPSPQPTTTPRNHPKRKPNDLVLAMSLVMAWLTSP